MTRRLKTFRTTNVDDSGETVKDFFTDIIGYQNVLCVDASKPNDEQLSGMSELIEQKGKPCCINMISDDDKKFLANLEKKAAKEARAKARAEAAAKAADEGASAEQSAPDDQKSKVEAEVSEEEVDEVDILIQKEQEQAEQQKRETEEMVKK